MTSARDRLEAYVASGKLTQLATLSEGGSPAVCNVWYDFSFSPDILRFISRHDRNHSKNIRVDGRVAGSIIVAQPEGLGQAVQGVTYTGAARELPSLGIDDSLQSFLSRWPAAEATISAGVLARGETPTRLYEIVVEQWVLFDEVNFPGEPRRVIAAIDAKLKA